MSDDQPNRYEYSPEDGERMNRLSEEVRGRLLEMALITVRAIGTQLPEDALVRFVPHKRHEDADAGAGDWMEIMDVDGNEVCYGVIGGKAFAESPCGASG